MKKLAAIIVLSALSALAQTAPGASALTLTIPPQVQGDGVHPTVATLTIGGAGIANLNLAAVGWTLVLPAGITLVPGGTAAQSVSVAAGKSAYSGADTGGCPPQYQGVVPGVCGLTSAVVLGLSSITDPNATINANPITSDGPLANVQVSIPPGTPNGNIPITLINANGADASGNLVPLTWPITMVIQYSEPSKCDVNSDGKVDYLDIIALLTPTFDLASNVASPAKCPLSGGFACDLQNLEAVLNAARGQACILH